ncbi:MAG: sigma-24 (FecI-like) [Anaeromyxobacteraceae bacterium]|nr:sigma-24 (FecI-like) [Anaeromyxobacteraceae bacterium]
MVAAHALPGIVSRLSWPAMKQVDRVLLAPPSHDASLAISASRGDRRAFTRLVEENKRSVYGLCLRLLTDPEEARDAAQEAFTRAYASLESYDLEQAFAPWVLRIARNHCLDLLRRRIPARARVELDAEDEDGPPRELADTTSERADDAIQKAQTREALDRAVAALPPNYREVVHLFHVEQLSYKEIATTMGIPLGTVMTWLHRARAQLRNLLEGHEVAP